MAELCAAHYACEVHVLRDVKMKQVAFFFLKQTKLRLMINYLQVELGMKMGGGLLYSNHFGILIIGHYH